MTTTFITAFSFLVGVLFTFIWIFSYVTSKVIKKGSFFFPYHKGVLVVTDANITTGALVAEADIHYTKELQKALTEYTKTTTKMIQDLEEK